MLVYCSVCGGEYDGTGTCPSDCLSGDKPFIEHGYCPSCGGAAAQVPLTRCNMPGLHMVRSTVNDEGAGLGPIDHPDYVVPRDPDPELERLLDEEEEAEERRAIKDHFKRYNGPEVS
jgi:hypothetical protein